MKGKEILKVIYSAGAIAEDVIDRPFCLIESTSERLGKAFVLTTNKPVNTDDVMFGSALLLIRYMTDEIVDILLSEIE